MAARGHRRVPVGAHIHLLEGERLVGQASREPFHPLLLVQHEAQRPHADKVVRQCALEEDGVAVLLGGGSLPNDRQIDGMDMRDFLLGDADQSGRDAILCLQGNRLQAVKWHQWKAHLFKQDAAASTFSPYNVPHLHNLEWDPREEHEIDFPHAWVFHPMAAAVGALLKSLAAEPPIKPGTPDPYTPPEPGELRPEQHLQIGVITQYVTSLTKSHDEPPDPHHGIEHATG